MSEKGRIAPRTCFSLQSVWTSAVEMFNVSATTCVGVSASHWVRLKSLPRVSAMASVNGCALEALGLEDLEDRQGLVADVLDVVAVAVTGQPRAALQNALSGNHTAVAGLNVERARGRRAGKGGNAALAADEIPPAHQLRAGQ